MRKFKLRVRILRKFAEALNYIEISELIRLNFDGDVYKFILRARYRVR